MSAAGAASLETDAPQGVMSASSVIAGATASAKKRASKVLGIGEKKPTEKSLASKAVFAATSAEVTSTAKVDEVEATVETPNAKAAKKASKVGAKPKKGLGKKGQKAKGKS